VGASGRSKRGIRSALARAASRDVGSFSHSRLVDARKKALKGQEGTRGRKAKGTSKLLPFCLSNLLPFCPL